MQKDIKYQIFVSSTYKDLIAERNKVIEAILELGHFPSGMEMFSAEDEDQWNIIKRAIDLSDYYVLIVANRYGSLTKGKISFTEREYNYAKEKNIPILSFCLAEDTTLNYHSDNNMDNIKIFKEKVLSNSKMSDFWKTPDDLKAKFSIAFTKQINFKPSRGWIRNNIDNENWIFKGFEEYQDIKWRQYIQQSSEIVFCIFYLDGWIKMNRNDFEDFFNKDNIELTIFLPDYRNMEVLKHINKVIPIYDANKLKERIELSIQEIKDMINNTNALKENINIFLYPHVFNYTFESFNNKFLFVSINEIRRQKTYQSPFFKINLKNSRKIQRFYNEEVNYLKKASYKLDF